MYRTIQYATDPVEGGAIATITLNRPERKNAISPEMANELIYALEHAEKDGPVRAVILRGAGGTFCSGGDFAQMAAGITVSNIPVKGDYADLLLAMLRFPRPIVARVEGVAMGGGLGLVAASHFAVAASDAVLGTPEIHRGLFPMMIMAVLARTVPRRMLLEMMLLGAKIPAAQAATMGLVNRVVPREELDTEVRTLATALALRSPTAIAHGLAAWSRQGDMKLDEALPMLRDALYELLGTDDAREGLTAFMEKRAPHWTGR